MHPVLKWILPSPPHPTGDVGRGGAAVLLLGSGIMDLCWPGTCREMHRALGWLAYLYFGQNFPNFLCLNKPASLVLSSAKAEVVPGRAGFAFCPHPKLGELSAA